MKKEQAIEVALAALKRRRRPFLVTLLLMLVLSVAVTLLIPSVYRSTATILIEQQEIPSDLVQSTVTSYADERIQMTTQRVMTFNNLWKIIKQYNLYPDEQAKQPREVVVDKLTKAINTQMISADVVDPRSGRPTQATIAFDISYDNKHPRLAQSVASELSSLYMQENIDDRTRTAKQTEQFLSQQAEQLDTRLQSQEDALAAFKKKNFGKLPELQDVNLKVLESTQQEQSDTDRQLDAARQRLNYLQGQLATQSPYSAMMNDSGQRVLSMDGQLKLLQRQLIADEAQYSDDHPTVIRLKRQIAALKKKLGTENSAGFADLEKQRQTLQARISTMSERYGSDYPDLQKLKRELQAVEKQITTQPGKTRDVTDADNPVYVDLQTQLQNTRLNLQSLEQHRKELSAKLAKYEGRLDATPEVESKYQDLLRAVNDTQSQYNQIRSKQLSAKVAQSMESENKGERFSLIQPPLLPEKPVKPNRPLIFVLGVFLSLAAAAGLVYLLESMDKSIHSRYQLAELVGVAPLAIVPYIVTPSEVAAQRRARVGMVLLFVALVVAALCAVNFLYKPLDVIWYSTLRKWG